MASINELWLTDFGDPSSLEPAHRRPGLVVGPSDIFGEGLPFVMVCPLTTTRRELWVHAEVEADEATGLDTTSYVQCEQFRSVNRNRLVHRLGTIDQATKAKIDEIIDTLLGR